VPATPGREGGQRLILATPNPNQSRVPIGWMGANNELWNWRPKRILVFLLALPR